MTTPPMPPVGMPPPPAPLEPDAPKQRPTTVTAAAGVLMLIGVLSLISTILTLAILGTAKERFAEAARASGATDTTIDQMSGAITIGAVVGIVFSIVVIIAIAVLALLNLKGNNVGRIVTWVVCGLFLLCSVCGLAGQGIGNVASGGDAGQALNDAAANMYPGWFTSTSLVLAIVQSLAYVAVIVLLALPQSHDFFRKTPPAFQPPVGS